MRAGRRLGLVLGAAAVSSRVQSRRNPRRSPGAVLRPRACSCASAGTCDERECENESPSDNEPTWDSGVLLRPLAPDSADWLRRGAGTPKPPLHVRSFGELFERLVAAAAAAPERGRAKLVLRGEAHPAPERDVEASPDTAEMHLSRVLDAPLGERRRVGEARSTFEVRRISR